MTSEEKKKLLDQLEALKLFPNDKLVKALRKQILAKLVKTEKSKPEKEIPEFTEIAKEQKRINANVKRSSFMKKKWNYIRQIYGNYPEVRKNYRLRDIFSMYSKRKRGEKIPIGDVYWQNPSQ